MTSNRRPSRSARSRSSLEYDTAVARCCTRRFHIPCASGKIAFSHVRVLATQYRSQNGDRGTVAIPWQAFCRCWMAALSAVFKRRMQARRRRQKHFRAAKVGPMDQFSSNLVRSTVLATALFATACSEKPAQAPAASAPSVTIASPVKRTVTDWDEYTGRFEAVDQVDVRARVGGFVIRVGFSDGEIVRKDDLLYLIDSRPYDAV